MPLTKIQHTEYIAFTVTGQPVSKNILITEGLMQKHTHVDSDNILVEKSVYTNHFTAKRMLD